MLRKKLLSELKSISLEEKIDREDWDSFNKIVFNFANEIDIPIELARNCTRVSDILSAHFSGNQSLVNLLMSSERTSIENKLLNEIANISNIKCSTKESCVVYVNHSIISKILNTWHCLCMQNPNSFISLLLHLAFTVSLNDRENLVNNETQISNALNTAKQIECENEQMFNNTQQLDCTRCKIFESEIRHSKQNEMFEAKIHNVIETYLEKIDTTFQGALKHAISIFKNSAQVNLNTKRKTSVKIAIRKLDKNIQSRIAALELLQKSKCSETILTSINSNVGKLTTLLKKSRSVNDSFIISKNNNDDDDDNDDKHITSIPVLRKIANQLNVIGKSIAEELFNFEKENRSINNSLELVEEVVASLPNSNEKDFINEPGQMNYETTIVDNFDGMKRFLQKNAFNNEELFSFDNQLRDVYTNTLQEMIDIDKYQVTNKQVVCAVIAINLLNSLFRKAFTGELKIGFLLSNIFALYGYFLQSGSENCFEIDLDLTISNLNSTLDATMKENEFFAAENAKLLMKINAIQGEYETIKNDFRLTTEKNLLILQNKIETINKQQDDINRLKENDDKYQSVLNTVVENIKSSSSGDEQKAPKDDERTNISLRKIDEFSIVKITDREQAIKELENQIENLSEENKNLAENLAELKARYNSLKENERKLQEIHRTAIEEKSDLKRQIKNEKKYHGHTRLQLQSESRKKKIAIKRSEKLWRNIFNSNKIQNDAKKRFVEKVLQIKLNNNNDEDKEELVDLKEDSTRRIKDSCNFNVHSKISVDERSTHEHDIEKSNDHEKAQSSTNDNGNKTLESEESNMEILTKLKRKHSESKLKNETSLQNFLKLLEHNERSEISKAQSRFANNAITKIQKEVRDHKRCISDSNSINDDESNFYSNNKHVIEDFLGKARKAEAGQKCISWQKIFKFLGATYDLNETDIELMKFFNDERTSFQARKKHILGSSKRTKVSIQQDI